jgi:hypothetical protein
MRVVFQDSARLAALMLALFGVVNDSAAIDVVVSRVTGQISFVNPSATPAVIAGYSISSNSGALLPANWLSIAENYDANDGGEVDPNDTWLEISSSSSSLAEGEFNGNGGLLDPGEVVSLGLAWDPFRAQDLTASIVGANNQSMPVTPMYESFAADFDGNLSVDRNDLPLWKICFLGGCTTGDADKSGVVDGRDYFIWLSQAGSVGPIPPPGSIGAGASAAASFASTAIPEPATGLLSAFGLTTFVIFRYRKR